MIWPMANPPIQANGIWVKPEYSRTQVRKAGEVLLDPMCSEAEEAEAEKVLDNWRMSHAFPLNTLQMLLRLRAKAVQPNAEVVQRLKRRPSVFRKLHLKPTMGLERMQDIAGCRAVLASPAEVYEILGALINGRGRHRIRSIEDYIAQPKEDGYRSLHIVVQYQSRRYEAFNKHLVEMQIRTLLQHAWSTAVETSGTFIGWNLKGGEGPSDWLEFFRLVSSEFASIEGTNRVPGTLPSAQCKERIAELATRLNIFQRLSAYSHAMSWTESKGWAMYQYFILRLQREREGSPPSLRIEGYTRKQLKEAGEKYSELEQQAREEGLGTDIVLVSADSMATLREAYSNYFANTSIFLTQLREVITPDTA